MAEETSKKKDEKSTPKWLAFGVYLKAGTLGFGWIIGGLLVIILREDLLFLGIIFILCGLGYISLIILVATPLKSKKKPETIAYKHRNFSDIVIIIIFGIAWFGFILLLLYMITEEIFLSLFSSLILSVFIIAIISWLYHKQMKAQIKKELD